MWVGVGDEGLEQAPVVRPLDGVAVKHVIGHVLFVVLGTGAVDDVSAGAVEELDVGPGEHAHDSWHDEDGGGAVAAAVHGGVGRVFKSGEGGGSFGLRRCGEGV